MFPEISDIPDIDKAKPKKIKINVLNLCYISADSFNQNCASY